MRPRKRRGLGQYLKGLLVNLGEGALGAVPGLFTVLIIFLVTRLVVHSTNAFFNAVETGRLETTWIEPGTVGATRRLVVAVIWIFAITVAYPYIPGSDTAAFKGVSVFVGLMVSLGSAGLPPAGRSPPAPLTLETAVDRSLLYPVCRPNGATLTRPPLVSKRRRP